jgi:hypothetical protein
MLGHRLHVRAAGPDVGDLVRRLGRRLSERLAAASRAQLVTTLAAAAVVGLTTGTELHAVVSPPPRGRCST